MVSRNKNTDKEELSSSLISINELKSLQKILEKETGNELFWGDNSKFELKLLPLDIPTLDNALDGGLAFDRVTMIYGEASAGKTLIALLAIKSAQKRNVSVAYVDVERVWVPEWAEKIGVKAEDVLVSRPRTGEDVWKIVMALTKAKVGVIVVDSIAAIASSTSLDKDIDEMFEKRRVMDNAMLNQEGLKNAVATNDGSMIILINQLRLTPTMYGNPESIPGGKNLSFAAWQKIRVKRGEWIEEGTGSAKAKVGYMLRVVAEKNKQGAPFQEGEVPFFFTGSIDYLFSMVQDALDRGIIVQTGSMYSYNELKIRGKEALLNEFRSSPSLENQLSLDLAAPVPEVVLE